MLDELSDRERSKLIGLVLRERGVYESVMDVASEELNDKGREYVVRYRELSALLDKLARR